LYHLGIDLHLGGIVEDRPRIIDVSLFVERMGNETSMMRGRSSTMPPR
jgi:hypothetical protein